MIKKIIQSVTLLSSIFILSSCAGLIGGKNQTIFLMPTGNADEVEVEVITARGRRDVTIPGSIQVPRNKMPLRINVKETRCIKSSKTFVPSQYNIFLVTNALGGVFGLIGTTMDMNSGAAWAYDDNVHVNVREKRSCR